MNDEPDYPGDLHWYDLPDDEAESDDAAPAPESPLRRLVPRRLSLLRQSGNGA